VRSPAALPSQAPSWRRSGDAATKATERPQRSPPASGAQGMRTLASVHPKNLLQYQMSVIKKNLQQTNFIERKRETGCASECM
jgi:hypothetical protein